MAYSNNYRLNVDIKNTYTITTPTFRQGDNGKLIFKIYDDNKLFDLSNFTEAKVVCKLPNKDSYIGTATINDQGEIEYELSPEIESSQCGYVEVILSIYSGNSVVSVQPFNIYMYNNNLKEDTQDVGIIKGLIQQIQIITAEVNQIIKDAQKAIDDSVSMGTFVLSNQYKKNNTVLDNGSTWVALTDTRNNPLPVLPSIENSYWRLVASRGYKGDRGERGEAGASIKVIGVLANTTSLPPTGQEGDAYAINGEIHVWSEESGSWINVGGIKGDITKVEMGINQYKLESTLENQSSWKIPLETFSLSTDTVIVIRNTTILSRDMYVLEEREDGIYIRLTITAVKEKEYNNLNIIIFKAKESIPNSTFNGSLITNGSIPLSKLSKDTRELLVNLKTSNASVLDTTYTRTKEQEFESEDSTDEKSLRDVINYLLDEIEKIKLIINN